MVDSLRNIKDLSKSHGELQLKLDEIHTQEERSLYQFALAQIEQLIAQEVTKLNWEISAENLDRMIAEYVSYGKTLYHQSKR